ncbi:MAG: oligosaccharide flippase family protein [Niameybacter sp.]|nr:oligosaccharide flippase family protein [Niameybacter sp.]
MKKIIKNSNNNFINNILVIASGTACAQLINTILSPVITRIYSPEEYGILTLYTSIIGIFSVITSLRYESTIAIADDEDTAINMGCVSLYILMLMTIIYTIFIGIFGSKILAWFQAEGLYKYRYLIPIGLFFIGLYNICVQWAYRNKDFKTISTTKLSQSIIQNLIKILCGILGFGPIGLIVGTIAGQSAGFFNLAKPLLRSKKRLFASIEKNKMINGAKRYIRFPLFSTPSQILNIAGVQLPVIFITALFGNEATGLYGLANSIINLPFSLVSGAISDVYYSEAASIGKKNPRRLRELSKNLLKKLFLIGIFPTVIVVLFGPVLFSIVFGEAWYQAGQYAQIIVILVFVRFIFMPISRVYEVYEKQKEAFLLDAMRLMLVLMSFIVSRVLSFNAYLTIAIYSMVMCIVYFSTYLMSQKILTDEIRKHERLIS